MFTVFFYHFYSHSLKLFCFVQVSATTNNNKAISVDWQTRFDQAVGKHNDNLIDLTVIPFFQGFEEVKILK